MYLCVFYFYFPPKNRRKLFLKETTILAISTCNWCFMYRLYMEQLPDPVRRSAMPFVSCLSCLVHVCSIWINTSFTLYIMMIFPCRCLCFWLYVFLYCSGYLPSASCKLDHGKHWWKLHSVLPKFHYILFVNRACVWDMMLGLSCHMKSFKHGPGSNNEVSLHRTLTHSKTADLMSWLRVPLDDNNETNRNYVDKLFNEKCMYIYPKVKVANNLIVNREMMVYRFLAQLSRRLEWAIAVRFRPSCVVRRPSSVVRKLFTFSSSSWKRMVVF